MIAGLNAEQIKKIFYNIFLGYPQTDCFKLDSFIYLANGDDTGTSKMDKTIEDFNQNNFFSWSWYNKGQKLEDLCAKMPMVILERERIQVTPTGDGDIKRCITFTIAVAVPYDCTNCGSCAKTKVDADELAISVIEDFIFELRSYCIWNVTFPNGEDENYIFANHAYIEYLIAENKIIEADDCGEWCLSDAIQDFEIAPYNNIPFEKEDQNKVIWGATFVICTDCNKHQSPVTYSTKDAVKPLGVTTCSVC